jgi:hypothetical protein
MNFIVPSEVLPKWFRTAKTDIDVGKPFLSSSLELVLGLPGGMKAKQFCLRLWCYPLEVVTVLFHIYNFYFNNLNMYVVGLY